MAAPDFVAPNYYAEATATLRAEPRAISRQPFKSAIALAEGAADFLTCCAGFAAAYEFCASPPFGAPIHLPAARVAGLCAAFGTFVLFLQIRDGAYRAGGGLLQIRETERAIRTPAQGAFLFWMVSLLLNLNLSAFVLFATAGLVSVMLIFQKWFSLALIGRLQQSGKRFERVVVYGAGDFGRSVLSGLLDSPRLGLCPVAVIDDCIDSDAVGISAMGYRGRRTIPVHAGPITASLLESWACDFLVVAAPDLPTKALGEAVRAVSKAGAKIAILSGPADRALPWSEWVEVDGMHLCSSKRPRSSQLYAFSKRVADMVLSSILLLLLAPVLILIAVLVRLDSPGPALFVQKRVGLHGELFDMYKFRSMFAGAAKYAPSPTSATDPRITRIGRFLRRASLDELPQLMNVFKGTMSLVGPRPEMPFIVERYDARQRQRLQVVPGITGLWQLSADRAYPIHTNVEYDLYYIRNRNFVMDIAILIHTMFFAICGGI
jgi:exopolysaccharide biosynthesis polyprenyl glycosylphosphotransferase